jgi:hypothetical protein
MNRLWPFAAPHTQPAVLVSCFVATTTQMFEPTWYKCGKLNPDLLLRAESVADMEAEGTRHILTWLGEAWISRTCSLYRVIFLI